jgi:putative addiction module component (TIGR02574 family)
MRAYDIPEIAMLSTPEKILLIEDIWDSIREDQNNISVPRSHVTELMRRITLYHANPGTLLTLEELQTRIEKKK